MSLRGQDVAHLAQPQLEGARDIGHGREQQVAQVVALQTRPQAEAVLQERAHQRLHIGQRDDALAEVAGGQDAQVAAQPARAPAVVGHGHDGREPGGIVLEAREQDRQPGPAANGHDPGAAP